jgi:hypothetical protein
MSPSKRPSKTSFGCGLAFCLGVALLASPAQAADEKADFVVKLFTSVCVPNMGNPAGVRAWAAEKNLTQIAAPAAFDIFVGPGGKGAAWAVPTTIGNFALSIRGTTQACAVWARTADPKDVENLFKQLIEGTKRPGLEIRTDKDTVEGNARVLVYNLHAPPAPAGFEFTMLTAQPGAPFQASLQVAAATAP